MRKLALILAGIAAALIGFAAPVSAHTQAWSTAHNGLTEFNGSYMDVAPFWCYNPSGTTDLASIDLLDTYANSNASWTIKVINYDTGAVKYNDGSTYLGYGDRHFIDLETSGPPAETGGDWYVWIEMDPDIGINIIWRIAIKHATGHGSPFTDVTDIDTITYSQAECS